MTRLRKTMLEELQRRNYSQTTVKAYLHSVEAFAKHFHRPPDQLGRISKLCAALHVSVGR